MEEGEGIGLDPVRGARQQQAEQARLVKLVEQRRRQPARALDLAGGNRNRGAERLGAGDHAAIARQACGSRNQRIQRIQLIQTYARRAVAASMDSSAPAANSRSMSSIDLPRVSIPRK